MASARIATRVSPERAEVAERAETSDARALTVSGSGSTVSGTFDPEIVSTSASSFESSDDCGSATAPLEVACCTGIDTGTTSENRSGWVTGVTAYTR